VVPLEPFSKFEDRGQASFYPPVTQASDKRILRGYGRSANLEKEAENTCRLFKTGKGSPL